jgi:GNAT superfamily N-acetyltransferase
MNFHIRNATLADVPGLRELIEASVRGLQAQHYSPAQIEGALQSVYGVDSQLIADGTYFVAEDAEPQSGTSIVETRIVGCGGWSKRRTLYGGDQYAGREDLLLDPTRDPAKIRAFFVHPQWARRGIGGLILEACENAARGVVLHAPGDGSDFERRGFLSGERVLGVGKPGSAARQRRRSAHCKNGEASQVKASQVKGP